LLQLDLSTATRRYEHAFALGCQIGDPCWEGLAQRGLGLLRAASGDIDAAVEHLVAARSRALRSPDAYVWVAAYALDSLCEIASREHRAQADAWIDDLFSVSSRTGMRELAARSFLYRARCGSPDALAAAQLLAAEIQNPALREQCGLPALV
jgi:hypothetical protein